MSVEILIRVPVYQINYKMAAEKVKLLHDLQCASLESLGDRSSSVEKFIHKIQ